MRFRGREMAHQHIGMEVAAKVKAEFADVAKVEIRAEARRPPDGDGARRRAEAVDSKPD